MARAEGIVDLATNLRQLAALAYQNTENSRVEEEIVEQFIRALDTKELRVNMNQSDPKTLDEAVNVALRLESIHLAVIQNNAKIGTHSVHVGSLNEVLSQGTPNYNCTLLSIVTMLNTLHDRYFAGYA